MRIGLIGLGDAGAKIVDTVAGSPQNPERGNDGIVLAIAASERTLESLNHILSNRQLLIGEQKVKGHGTGADIGLGAEVVELGLSDIQQKLEELGSHRVDALVIVVGLADGTGGGGGPVLATHLDNQYMNTDIYGVGIAPDEDAGQIYIENADQSVQPFVTAVDTALTVQDTAGIWRQGESVQYKELLETITQSLRAASVFT